MIRYKMSPALQLALRYENLLNEDFKSLFLQNDNGGEWELVMHFAGTLAEIQQKMTVKAIDLKGGFAQIVIPKDEIAALTDLPEVIYLAIPARYEYITVGLGQICASNLSESNNSVPLTGKGVLLAVIDSGIDYSHPDFREEDGTSRILYLWDQTLPGEGVDGRKGQVFSQRQLNEALAQPTREEQLKRVPSQDLLGHGTAMAGIAAGNGRGSAGQKNKGVAPECSLLIVKVGKAGSPAPRDVEIMAGIDFCIEKAEALGMPMTVLLGIGSNLSAHDGTEPLETYIDARYNSWLCNFVVGTGNQGDKGSHASGQLIEGQSQVVELLIEGDKVSYACGIWFSFVDEISLVIEAPNGEMSDELSRLTRHRAYLFDETAVLVNFSESAKNWQQQTVAIVFQGQNGAPIDTGIWRLVITGHIILEGAYNIWASIVREAVDRTGFLTASLEMTLTSPATARRITAVGAYNGSTSQIAAFSGRGFTADHRVAPDLAAPGVAVTVPLAGGEGGYTMTSGSSSAGAYVAGAYVLLMSYGIGALGNVNLYGETLEAYLLKGAKRPSAYAPYPNSSWGYGSLCVSLARHLIEEVEGEAT